VTDDDHWVNDADEGRKRGPRAICVVGVRVVERQIRRQRLMTAIPQALD